MFNSLLKSLELVSDNNGKNIIFDTTAAFDNKLIQVIVLLLSC